MCRRYRNEPWTGFDTNCLRLMQWNANGISGRFTELLTFRYSNNVNIAAIQKAKLTNKTKPLKTPGLAAERHDRHKNKGGDLLMLINDTIPFVDNTAALPQSADPHLEEQGTSITIPNRQQLHNHSIYIPPRSSCILFTTHRSRISSATMKCRLLLGILMRITPDGIRTQTKMKEANNYLTKSMQPTTPFLTRMKLRGYRQMAGQLRPTLVWPPMTSHYYQTGQSLPHWPAIICPSSSPSTPNCPRLMGLGETTSTSRKRNGHVMLKPATNTLLKLAKQELSNKPRRPSGKQ